MALNRLKGFSANHSETASIKDSLLGPGFSGGSIFHSLKAGGAGHAEPDFLQKGMMSKLTIVQAQKIATGINYAASVS